MKKLALCILPCILLSACGSINSYSSLIDKMKSYSGETVMTNNYMNGYYTEEGFMLYGGEIVLYLQGVGSSTNNYVFITLPNSTRAPNTYYCLYSWDYPQYSYSETASFYIDNNYTSYTTITFSRYNGDSSSKRSAEQLAESSVNLLLVCFDSWLSKEHSTSMKRVGMFPNF